MPLCLTGLRQNVISRRRHRYSAKHKPQKSMAADPLQNPSNIRRHVHSFAAVVQVHDRILPSSGEAGDQSLRVAGSVRPCRTGTDQSPRFTVSLLHCIMSGFGPWVIDCCLGM